MPIISSKDQKELKKRFRRELKQDVTIKFFTQSSSALVIPGKECRYCEQTQQLLEELTSLSPHLHLEIYNFYTQQQEAQALGVERIPAVVFMRNGHGNMKFYGIPLGFEFRTLLDDLFILSRNVSPLKMQTRKQLRKVNRSVHIKVLVTPDCQNSPHMAKLAHVMSMENSWIKADVIEAQEFPAVAKMFNIKSVPKTVINDITEISGVVPEEVLLERILHIGVDKTTSEDSKEK